MFEAGGRYMAGMGRSSRSTWSSEMPFRDFRQFLDVLRLHREELAIGSAWTLFGRRFDGGRAVELVDRFGGVYYGTV